MAEIMPFPAPPLTVRIEGEVEAWLERQSRMVEAWIDRLVAESGDTRLIAVLDQHAAFLRQARLSVAG
ncbi:MAG: hypothetical protein NXI12_11015 [Alphaproteobacteria bacterium]|nr:hypothetical protein [Alphaproteobacteria bacterium]